MIIRWSNFCLPAADLCAFQCRSEKDTAVTIGLLFEFQAQFEIIIEFSSRQVAVLSTRSALADELTIFYIPFLFTMVDPSFQVFTIE